MSNDLKKDLIDFLAECFYEGSDAEFVLKEFRDIFIKACEKAEKWRMEENS